MKTKGWIILGASVAAGVGLVYLIKRKNTLSNTGSFYTPVVNNLSTGGQTIQAPVGNQVYTTQANVILRSSAQTSNPVLGLFGGNVDLTIPVAGTWIGALLSTTTDTNGDINPATGSVYLWYQIQLSSVQQANFSLPAGTTEYVRQDMVTIK